MPHNEEGEFELVLGNRQLLSVFFIVVVLLGVFFVMGYILGKNSGPSAPATEIASAKKPTETGPPPSPIIVDKTSNKPSAVVEPPERKVEREVPKREEPKPEPVREERKPEKKAAREEAKPEPKREPAPPREAPAKAGDAKTGTPPKGSLFMQVAAVGRAEGDVLAKVLRGKGYSVWIAPTEKENIFRVLVGPIDAGDKGKYKTELVGLGFSPFPRAY